MSIRKPTKRNLNFRMEKAKQKIKGNAFSKKLAQARAKENDAIRVADDIRVLKQWEQNDILALGGHDATTRTELCYFVIESLYELERFCQWRIWSVRNALFNQRGELLAFAKCLYLQLDLPLDLIASKFAVKVVYLREMLS